MKILSSLMVLRFTLAAVVLTASVTPARQAVPLHVLKIAAGPSGAESKGTFVLNQERSIYNRTGGGDPRNRGREPSEMYQGVFGPI